NTATNDGFSESLKAQGTGVTPDVISAAGTATISPGGTSGAAISATISTATAGNRSGTVAIKLDSLAGAQGLSNSDLGTRTATVTAKVYNLGSALVQNTQPINFGIKHVNDVITPINLAIKNNAPVGFSENLDAAFGTVGTGLTTNSGSFSLLAPQA